VRAAFPPDTLHAARDVRMPELGTRQHLEHAVRNAVDARRIDEHGSFADFGRHARVRGENRTGHRFQQRDTETFVQ